MADLSRNKTWSKTIKGRLARSRNRAKRNGLEFTITEADVVVPEFCPVLGLRLDQNTVVRQQANTPSLDRFDNSKGYIPGNVRVISFRANKLKSDATAEEMRRVLAYMEGRI